MGGFFLSLVKLYEKEGYQASYHHGKNHNPDRFYLHHFSSLGNINQPITKDNSVMIPTPISMLRLEYPLSRLPTTPAVKEYFATSKNSSPNFFLLSIPNHYKREVLRCLC